VGKILKHALPQDFIKFGMIPEFVGRVPVVVSLDELDRDALIRILTEPKNAIVKQYQGLFELDGVELKFTPEAIEAVADRTLKRKTGARGLRAIMETAMMDLMYQIPSDEMIESCLVTKEVIEGTGEPELTYRELTGRRKRRIGVVQETA
jgi:ATP-dependent Clp protease ATP-binding subunit ClpX